jgi:hypothetical protein
MVGDGRRRQRPASNSNTVGVYAPLPAGLRGHFGAELHRFALVQHHHGQVTVARLLTQLRAMGIDISKRQVMRLLIARTASSTRLATCCAPA